MTKERNKTEQVYHTIREQIRNGILKPDSRVGSVRLLIDRFKVSQPVIMGALKRLEDDGLIRREPRRGVFVEDVSGKKPPLIGLYTFYTKNNVENYFESLNKVLLERNVLSLPFLTANSTRENIRMTRAHEPNGFLVDARSEDIGQIRKKLGTDAICLVNILELYPDIDIPFSAVLSDRHHGMVDAVERLCDDGHQSIILAMTQTPPPPENRYTQHSLRRIWETFPDTEFHEMGVRGFSDKGGDVRKLFNSGNPPTAILGFSDYSAYNVSEWLSRLHGPHDLKIIGFYNTQWSRQPGREFATYDMNYEMIWSRAIEILLNPDPANKRIEWIRPSFVSPAM